MIKRVQILIIILFVAAAAVFFINRIHERRTQDFRAPVITAESDKLQASVNVSDAELLEGMRAMDNKDGDVTGTLVVASRSKFIRPNTVKVHYAAFDNNNNVGTFVRELTYTDYVSPRFSLSAPLCYLDSTSNDASQILKSIKAFDCIDGDISQQIMVTQGDFETIGDGVKGQPVSLQVSNRTGDTVTLEFMVRFEDYNVFNQQKPHLSQYLTYIKKGDTPPSWIMFADGVGYGNRVTSFIDAGFSRYPDVQVDTSAVDYNTPGSYEVIYTLTKLTESGVRMPLGSTVMVLIVEEPETPVTEE